MSKKELRALCNHETTREISTVCFAGPIAGAEENRAAHGNITVTDECNICGALRSTNINGRHAETGPWGPSLASRKLQEERSNRRRNEELARVRELIAQVPCRRITNSTGRVVTARLDPDDGMIVLDDYLPSEDPRPILAAVGSAWLEQARAVRTAYLLAAHPTGKSTWV